MDRQLKRTAFFGTERRPRPPERHYKAPGTQAPLPDIACRVVVGGSSDPTTDTPEFVPAWPVTLVDQAATRAFTAGVTWVHEYDGHANQHRLVDDQATQFVEAPVRYSRPLVPVDLAPLPNALKVFQGDQAPAAFGIGDNGFAQDMVGMALKPSLLTGSAPERTLGGTGADLLQGSASGMLSAADVVDLGAGIRFAVIVNSEIDDTHVYSDGIIGTDQLSFVSVTGRGEHPFPAHEHQIDLTLGTLQQWPLPNATSEFDGLSARQRPDRNGVLPRQEPEDAFVVGLGGMFVEAAPRRSIASLQTVSDLGDTPNGGLRRQSEARPQFDVPQFVQSKLSPRLCVRCDASQPVAPCVAPLQGIAQQTCLFWGGQQTDGGDQLHRSDTLLSFDVAPHVVPPVDGWLKELIAETAEEHGMSVHTMEVMPDLVHLFVEAGPTLCVAEIVNRNQRAFQPGVAARIRLPALASSHAVEPQLLRRFGRARIGRCADISDTRPNGI